MNTTILIDAVTFLLSVVVAAFVSGRGAGRMESDVKAINERLARIEGMFTLRLKDPSDQGRLNNAGNNPGI